MGNMHGTIRDPNDENQEIEVGYGVEAPCDRDDCTVVIPRGLSQVCGGEHGGGTYGCGRYFCDDDLYLPLDLDTEFLCRPCLEKTEGDVQDDRPAPTVP